MKIFRILSKRGLALFLVLTMCLSLLPSAALAAEIAEAAHTHNEDGWTCVEESQLICGCEQEHTHEATCWADSEETLTCTLEEAEGHTHSEECWDEAGELICGQEETEGHTHDGTCFAAGEQALVCKLAEHQHSKECYAPVWTCTEPTEDVSRFLHAVKAIPEEITPANAEEAEVRIAEAIEAWQHLGGAERTNASVVKAYDAVLAAEIAVEAAKAGTDASLMEADSTKDDFMGAGEGPLKAVFLEEPVKIAPAALVEMNEEAGAVSLYFLFAYVSQVGWSEEWLDAGMFLSELTLEYGDGSTTAIAFEPEAMQDDVSAPVELTEAQVYYNGEAVTVYAGVKEELPEEFGQELLAQNQQQYYAWITNRAIKNFTLSSSEINSSNGTAVATLQPTITVGGVTYVFWKAVVHSGDGRQKDHSAVSGASRPNLSNGSTNDQSGSGTKIDKIRYQDSSFQYCPVDSNEWTRVNSNDQLDFYYYEVSKIADEVTVSITDWGDSAQSASSNRSITYKVIDIDTREPVTDTDKVTWFNYQSITSTSILVAPDASGLFTIAAVTVGSALPGDWAGGSPNEYQDAKTAITIQLPTCSSGQNAGTHNTVYIYVRPTNGVKVNYLDAATNQPIGSGLTATLSTVSLPADIIENGILKTNATYTTYYKKVLPIPHTLPGSYTEADYEPQHVRAELGTDGQTLNLYFAKKVYGLHYIWDWKDASGTAVTQPSALYAADGKPVSVKKPEDNSNLHNSDSYTVDTAYDSKTVLYEHDTAGNQIASYTFSGWKISDTGNIVTGQHQINGNGVNLVGHWVKATLNPSEDCTKTVTFAVVNGTWSAPQMGTANQTIQVVLTDVNGKWSSTGSYILTSEDIPASTGNTNYTNGIWTTSDVQKGTLTEAAATSPSVPGTVSDDVTYTITYQLDTVGYMVKYYFNTETNGVYPATPQVTQAGSGALDTAIPYATSTNQLTGDGFSGTAPGGKYLLDYITGNGVVTDTADNNVVDVYFALDANDNDTPDIYEATIIYQVEGGTWTAVAEGATEEDQAAAIAPQTVVVPLKKWNDETKAWEDRTEAEINADRAIPTGMLPLAGYASTDANWYKVDGEDVGAEAVNPASQVLAAKETYTFRYIFQPKANYGVNYYLVDTNDAQTEVTEDTEVVTVPANMELHRGGLLPHNSTVTLGKTAEDGVTQIPSELTVDGHHYVLRDADYTLTVSNAINAENVIDVYYDIDDLGGTDPENPGDDIPDKYQATVTYQIENGYWGMVQEDGEWTPDTADKTYVLTLKEYNEETGEWEDVTNLDRHIPTSMTANLGYASEGKWDEDPAEAEIKAKDELTFKHTFEKLSLTYQVKYFVYGPTDVSLDGGKYDSEVITAGKDVTEIKWADIADDYKIKVDGYVFDSVEPETLKLSEVRENVIKVYYAVDEIGKDGGTEGGDGIADRYQATVVYEAGENGTVTGKTTKVITLDDGNGNYVVSKKMVIGTEGVTPKGNEGYAFDVWTPNPYAEQVVDGGETYTFTASFDTDTKGGTDPENPGDDIPDKYQATVTYQIENGYWGMVQEDGEWTPDTADKTYVLTLKEYNEETGEWEDVTNLDRHIPTSMTANLGYASEGKWDEDPAEAEIKAKDELTFKHTFEKLSLTYQVKYFVYGPTDVSLDGGKYDSEVITAGKDVTEIKWADIADDYKIKVDGYVFDSVEPETLKLSEVRENVIKVYYAVDEIGKDGGTEGGDGIADRYQATVVYEAGENGTVTGKTTKVITLDDGNGNYVVSKKMVIGTEGVTPKGNEGYAFDVWTPNPYAEQVVDGGETYTFTASFDTDTKGGTDPENPGDDIPDKYQAEVVFNVVYGKWSDNTTSMTKVFTLTKDGRPSEAGSYTLTESDIPTSTADTGYQAGSWDTDPEDQVITKAGAAYAYTYVAQARTITINYVDDSTTPVELKTAEVINTTYRATYDVADKIPGSIDVGENHYIKESTDGTVSGTIGDNVVITITYTLDDKGTTNPDEGDGIPDKYQATVTFNVVNGAWTNGTSAPRSIVVTLMKDGEPAEDGTYQLPAERVPSGTPNRGYRGGTWDTRDNTSPVGKIVSGDTTFTLTYTLIPPVTPGGDGGGGGGGGTTIPDGPTPLAPDPGITITDQEVPLGAPGLNNTDHFDYIKGYIIDGQILVRPEANITRAEVATIFFRLMTKEFREANWATENDFTDVKSGDWYNNAISTCTRAGILKGYEDGTFKPNQTISREEFAAIAARFASEEVPAGGMFKDIAGRWSEKDIERAAVMGWIKGSNGLFRPTDKITRAEVIVIVNRMLDRVPDADHMLPDMKTFADNTPDMWWYADVQEATNSHEYDRAEDGVTGIWTALLPEQDWAALEKEWATAADANVADVAPSLGGEGEKLEEETKVPETTGDGDGKAPETAGDGEN